MRVLRRRPHGHADARAVHQIDQPQHHQCRKRNDRNLYVGETGAANLVNLLVDHWWESNVIAAPDDHRHILQDDRHADRGDQGGQSRRMPQWAIGNPFESPAEHHADHHRNQQTNAENQQRRHAGRSERNDHGESDHRPDHHHLTMSEVDQTDDAVHHRVAESDQRIDGAQSEAVDQLLEKCVHGQAFRNKMLMANRRFRLMPPGLWGGAEARRG
ncbi:MAG: hypothetical protein AW09_004159 [Candidatus Accumulibacter phosphatis]|uniref:Uncharacterized protein n=1 Tax=Candidatus Accumulibacter phosphatis TaxID=327160 RepID=A0A080LRB1_9PROT|nr:MAG: hypothetical protein AW09_004159 [Candidatus Accumulibacter phosphatis]